MPLDDMPKACEWERLAEAMDGEEEGARADRRARLPLNVTRTMLLKQATVEVAPMEAALIHCSSLGSATLNSASDGGLDTLCPSVVIPRELEEIRERVARAIGPFRAPEADFDLQVLARARELYVPAAGHLEVPLSGQLLAGPAIYVALPGSSLHLLKDIILEDLQGQATRFGPFAGPGLASFRSAVAWATGRSSISENNSRNNSNNSNNAKTANANANAAAELATLRSLGANADLFALDRTQRTAELLLLCALQSHLAQVRQVRYGCQVFVLHSALVHQCLVVRRGMSSRLPRPIFPVDRTIRSLATRNLLRLAGTLHVVQVGDGYMAAIVLFHAGVIKYNGDHVLRAVLPVLCGLSCLKLLLLCDHAERATSAREAIIATQAASEALRPEEVLVDGGRWLQAGMVLCLQNAPERRRGLEVTDQELWVREVRRYRNGQQRHATPRRLLDFVAAQDREPQITTVMEQTGGTLHRLYLPAHIDRNAVDEAGAVQAWIEWFRGLPVGVSAQQAAAATRVNEPARRARMAENTVTATRIARVRGPTGEGTFHGAVSLLQACVDLAWTDRRFELQTRFFSPKHSCPSASTYP